MVKLLYKDLTYATDGEDAIISAMKKTWPDATHQRCQEHFLGNLAEGVLKHDASLRKQMRQSLGGLPKEQKETEGSPLS